jgi:hypothetical protein
MSIATATITVVDPATERAALPTGEPMATTRPAAQRQRSRPACPLLVSHGGPGAEGVRWVVGAEGEPAPT